MISTNLFILNEIANSLSQSEDLTSHSRKQVSMIILITLTFTPSKNN